MAITNGYCTLAEYKNWITMRGSSTSTDTDDDSMIEIIIENISRYIDRETGSRFFADGTDATRYYTATDPYILRVDPLSAAPTTVSMDTSGQRAYTELTEDTDFELYPYNAAEEGQPYTQLHIIPQISTYTWYGWQKGIKVIAKFGYPSVPTDVKTATMMMAQNVNSLRAGQSNLGRITVSEAGVPIRPEEVPEYAQRVIAHYRGMV